MPSLRLLTVNAAVLPLDRSGLARLIVDHGADLVCVHGAPSLLRWRSISAALARQSGLVVVTGGRTSGGNLLMSSLGVDVLATRELTFAGGRGPRPPGAALAALRLLGSDVVVAAARFGSASQATQLRDALAGLVPADHPALVVIDGGDAPAGPVWRPLAADGIAVGSGILVDNRIGVSAATAVTRGAVEVQLELP